ncbi:MAG: MFS transporter [Chthoniobacter sp.]|nr:MFS transporter [Chthoniobacter sp.]
MSKQFTRLFGSFTVLHGAARELWITFTVKFLIVAAYAVTTSTIVPWLSHDLGMNDQEALALVTAWSIVITIVTLLAGSLTDALGLRRTFFLGVWICVIARAVMALVTIRWIALAFGLFPLAIGEALGTPVLIAATRKYSNTKQRSISFSMIYAIMNLGFLASGYIFDGVRQTFGEYGHWNLPVVGWEMTSYRTLFLVSWAIEVLVLPVIWLLRDGAEVTDEGVKITAVPVHVLHGSILSRAWETTRESAVETIEFFVKLVRQDGFYRLLSFLLLISSLKLVFMHMSFVFPTWGVRELGPGAPVGRLWAINSYFIIFLVPIVGALTQKFAAYRMVTLGGIITAASVFIMTLPPQWFESLAQGWLGDGVGHHYLGLHGSIHPYYVMVALYVIVLSFGEAFYSPRVYEYAAAIAPKGQEASYGALSYIPFLLGKFLIGSISGTLLAKFCPKEGERHSSILWLFVALTATIAPVGLIALQRFIRVQEAGRTGSDQKE